MAEPRVLERLTASDLFMLLWDDYGWPNQIGGLIILDGTSLLDSDGRVRIEAVRRQLEPRLAGPALPAAAVPTPAGAGLALWVDAPCFDLADHIGVHPLAAPGEEAQLLQACQELARRRLDPARPLWELWLLPGLPERRVGAFIKVHHVVADGREGGRLRGAVGPDRRCAHPFPPPWTPTPIPRRGYCWVTTCAGAGGTLGRGWSGLAHPGRTCVWPERPGRRGGRSSPSSAPHGPA